MNGLEKFGTICFETFFMNQMIQGDNNSYDLQKWLDYVPQIYLSKVKSLIHHLQTEFSYYDKKAFISVFQTMWEKEFEKDYDPNTRMFHSLKPEEPKILESKPLDFSHEREFF